MKFLNYLIRCSGDDAECVHTLAHERCDGRIDQAVTLELRAPVEELSHEHNPEVPALARASVTCVLGTVVDDFQ